MPRRTLAELADELADLSDEVALLEASADVALLADDANVVPGYVRRARFPHEVEARVDFAELTTTVDRRADLIHRRLIEDRSKFVDLLQSDLERYAAANGHLPPAEAVTRRLDALLDPSQPTEPIFGTDALVGQAEAFHAGELNAAARDGIDRAAGEATRQGLRPPGMPGLSVDVDQRIESAARRLAAAPHGDVIRAAQTAAYQAPRSLPAAQAVSAATTAAGDLSDKVLASRYARPAAQQAHNLGHQEGAATVPAVAHIYASELLDGNTCGPCSLIDGHEYDSEEEALADYPDGTYVDCEGGDACRGTLVYVWDSETEPTQQTPGDEQPPEPPPPPYPLGSTRPLPPSPEPPASPPPAATPPPTPPPAPTVEPAPIPVEPSPPAGPTVDELAQARAAIPAIRAELRQLAAAVREDALATLERVDALKLDRPPPRTVIHRDLVSGRREYRAEHSGEWDWFHGLSEREQVRLRRSWFYEDDNAGVARRRRLPKLKPGEHGPPIPPPEPAEAPVPRSRPTRHESHGAAPDEVASQWQRHFANAPESTDEVMREWLDVTRRSDAASTLARGKLPNPDLYGGLDVNALIESPFNIRTVFSSDLDEAAAHIAEQTRDLERQYAERAFRPARLGPPPYQMSAESFESELTVLEDEAARIAELGAGDEWAILDREDQEVLDRLAELVPDGVEDSANRLPPNELHQVILDLARKADLQ